MLIPTTIPIVPTTQNTRTQFNGETNPPSADSFAEYLERAERTDRSGVTGAGQHDTNAVSREEKTRQGAPMEETDPRKRSILDTAEAKEAGDSEETTISDGTALSGGKTQAKRLAHGERRDESDFVRTDRDKTPKTTTGDEIPPVVAVPERTGVKPLAGAEKGSRSDRIRTGAADRAGGADRPGGSHHDRSDGRGEVDAAADTIRDHRENQSLTKTGGLGETNTNHGDSIDSENLTGGAETESDDPTPRDGENAPAARTVDTANATNGLVESRHVNAREGDERNRRERSDDNRTARGRLEALRSADRTDRAESVASAEQEQLRSDRSSGPVREILVDLAPDGGDETSAMQTSQTARSAALEATYANGSARFVPQAQLARRLNGDLGRSIVRQANVMLRDADRGEIRLVIRPPELGRVRINLQMDNGHIAGRILVDNGSVREVFEQNLGALQRAFAEAGLELGDLEISAGGEERQGSGESGRSGRPRRGASDRFEKQVEPLVRYEYGGRHINLVA